MRRAQVVCFAMLLAVVACRKASTPPPPPLPPATVNGWILLNADPDSLRRSMDAAARYGVNHVQLSQDLIMNVDDVLGDDAKTQQRIERLNLGIQLAHERGIKAFIWAHEVSPLTPEVCYAPLTDASVLGASCDTNADCGPTNQCLAHTCQNVWENRAKAYRDGFAKLPGLDGVVLMFGSAPTPPWLTFCTCGWCEDNYPGLDAMNAPPAPDRMRMIAERVGGVIVNELKKELVARTFVHEPEEIAWHSQAYASLPDLPFLAMHKSDVQDWQPYNPPDSGLGTNGDHYGLLELDVAGEYYGLSALPFAAPDYFRYRLRQGVDKRVIGTATRIERGGSSALGTPNEINLVAISRWLKDPEESVDAVWSEFLQTQYGVASTDARFGSLRRILEDTFAIRLKAHYVLGVWAMEKGSDIPTDNSLEMFDGRGNMPKWAPAWQGLFDKLDKPTRTTIERVWQEGSEGVALAQADLELFAEVRDGLTQTARADLEGRLKHQLLSSRVFRDVKLVLFGKRMLDQHAGGADDTLVAGWMAWALADLAQVAEETEALGPVRLASAGRIREFAANTASLVPGGTTAVEPPALAVSPLRTTALTATSATLTFDQSVAGQTHVEFGLDAPSMDGVQELGAQTAGSGKTVTLTGLAPGQRYLAQVRVTAADGEHLSGYHWIFTPLK